MWEVKILGTSIYHIINWFFIYSFLGWVWESCYVSAKEHRLVNRGFVTGPLCTIYGFGALSVYLLLWPFEKNIIILYLAGMIVATVLEYLTSWLMELIFHASWWDYSKQPFNVKGRICLGASLGWGAFTIILFKVFQPAVVKITDLYPMWAGEIGVIIITILHMTDVVLSAIAAFNLKDRLEKLDEVMDELTGYLTSTRFYDTTIEMKRKVQHLMENYSAADFYEKYAKRMEVRQAVLLDYLEQHGLNEYKEEAKEKILGIQKKLKETYEEQNFIRKRMLSAYPHLKSAARKSKDIAVNKLFRKNQD